MVKAYFNIIKNDQYPKFCLIGIAPYTFNNWLSKTINTYNEFYYFPIIGHEKMEYNNSDRGKFIKTIFNKKYKDWLVFQMDSYLNAKDEEKIPFDLNDIDWVKHWTRDHYNLTILQRLNVKDELNVYEHKYYPETIKNNREILANYIEFCYEHNVTPIALMLPFSQPAQRHYPQKRLQECFDIIESFSSKMKFINLWNIKLPDSDFKDTTHLRMSGAEKITKIIKDKLNKIIEV